MVDILSRNAGKPPVRVEIAINLSSRFRIAKNVCLKISEPGTDYGNSANDLG